MENEVDLYLEQLRNKRKEISLIKLEIDRVTEEYKRTIKLLKNKLVESDRELRTLRDAMTFTVRLGDLMQEISRLSGIDINNIEVKLETNVTFDGEYDFLEMFDLLNKDKKMHCIRMDLKSVGRNEGAIKFHYFTFLPLDLELVQNDGNKLINHCSVITKRLVSGIYTEIDIDRDIENIILNFDMRYLETNDNVSWYPANLFSQALINCMQRKKDKVYKKSYK